MIKRAKVFRQYKRKVNVRFQIRNVEKCVLISSVIIAVLIKPMYIR